MSTHGYLRLLFALPCSALLLAGMFSLNAAAQSHEHHGALPQSSATTAAHSGQVAASGSYAFEVQYLPTETRVFPRTSVGQPLSAKHLRGEVVMQIRGNPQEYRYPLEYVPAAAGSIEHLVARVDVTQVRDGDMSVTFRVAELPLLREPSAEFTQVFALSSAGASAERATSADRAAGARSVASTAAPQISVAPATAADRTAIARQGTCPVMDQALGGHGTPLKVTIDGQSLFVCCRGCIRKVEQNPQRYLAEAAQLRGDR